MPIIVKWMEGRNYLHKRNNCIKNLPCFAPGGTDVEYQCACSHVFKPSIEIALWKENWHL